jgi:hypothetical protein
MVRVVTTVKNIAVLIGILLAQAAGCDRYLTKKLYA